VSITSPSSRANFTAPANITLTANAADSDGTIASVAFYYGTTLITTRTAAPFSFTWTGVPQGTYILTAVTTDDLDTSTTSAPVNVTVNQAVVQGYYIEVDHLNTPRLVADAAGTTVWKWDQQEPFGINVPDENPSAVGAFDLPLRLPGQYFDQETNLHYNMSRDYDPSIGSYRQSDPMGLKAGHNTYAYVGGNPLRYADPLGLTQQDINNMLDLANVTQPDLNVPSSVGTYPGGAPWGGITLPLPGLPVLISDLYLKELNCDQLQQLYEVLVHESIHRTRSVLDMITRPFDHPDIYQEAARRTREVIELIRNYCKCP
jgi:RHS repeat-associated protein